MKAAAKYPSSNCNAKEKSRHASYDLTSAAMRVFGRPHCKRSRQLKAFLTGTDSVYLIPQAVGVVIHRQISLVVSTAVGRYYRRHDDERHLLRSGFVNLRAVAEIFPSAFNRENDRPFFLRCPCVGQRNVVLHQVMRGCFSIRCRTARSDLGGSLRKRISRKLDRGKWLSSSR